MFLIKGICLSKEKIHIKEKNKKNAVSFDELVKALLAVPHKKKKKGKQSKKKKG